MWEIDAHALISLDAINASVLMMSKSLWESLENRVVYFK